MNAIAARMARTNPMADAWAALRASTSRRHRMWMLAMSAVMLLAACALSAFAPHGGAQSNTAGMLAALANFALWSGLFGRLALLRSQAVTGCTPGVAGAIRAAVAGGAALTVLLPGGLLLAAGLAPTPAFAMPALGALAGLLFVLMPSPLAAALCMAPGLAGMLLRDMPGQLEDRIGIDLFSMMFLPLLILIGTLAAAWCWGRVARMTDPAAIPRWRRPMVMFNPMNAMDLGATSTDTGVPGMHTHTGWLAPVIRIDTAGPHDPHAAIGALLGGPMGQVAPRDAARQWGLIAFAVAVVVFIPFHGDIAFLRDAALFGALIGLLAGGWTLAMRLDRQRQRPSGEYAELALLPGVGAPRLALLRGVLRRLGQLMLVALAALLLLAWVRDTSGSQVALLIAMFAGVAAASVFMCLVALAGPGLATIRMGLTMLPLLVTTFATLLVVMLRIPAGSVLIWGAVWAVLTCGYLAAALVPFQTFRNRAHAFLID